MSCVVTVKRSAKSQWRIAAGFDSSATVKMKFEFGRLSRIFGYENKMQKREGMQAN